MSDLFFSSNYEFDNSNEGQFKSHWTSPLNGGDILFDFGKIYDGGLNGQEIPFLNYPFIDRDKLFNGEGNFDGGLNGQEIFHGSSHFNEEEGLSNYWGNLEGDLNGQEIPDIFKNKKTFQPSNLIEEKRTAPETVTELKDELCAFQEIKGLLEKDEKDLNCILKVFTKTKLMEEEEELEKNGGKYKKRRRDNYEEEQKGLEKVTKRGRKGKNPQERAKHTKNKADNILKKVKLNFIANCLSFVNKIIKIEKKKKCEILKKLKFEFIGSLKRDNELKLLNSTLGEVLSQEISEKYKKSESYFNKDIIKSYTEEKNEQYNLTISEVLNIGLNDWLNIFTMKKEISELPKLNSETYKKIEDAMPKLSSLLKTIQVKNSNEIEYLSNFIFCLYNYKWLFSIKTSKKNNNNNLIMIDNK